MHILIYLWEISWLQIQHISANLVCVELCTYVQCCTIILPQINVAMWYFRFPKRHNKTKTKLFASHLSQTVYSCLSGQFLAQNNLHLKQTIVVCLHKTSLSSLQIEHFLIIYSPSSRSKQTWLTFFHGSQKLVRIFTLLVSIQRLSNYKKKT